MSNHLENQMSPYLLQHMHNPVDWYPWGKEAFERAKREDKPIFLSIGYSTCHWCHVMAHESFEDLEIADILNQHFISIKVDKEERPDIDSIYMTVCQTFTGRGGWPTSVFMNASQKPFFAGTYFPKTAHYGSIGFKELLLAIHEKWEQDRAALLQSADEITSALSKSHLMNQKSNKQQTSDQPSNTMQADFHILIDAVSIYKQSYDKTYGGFGKAPKFPSPHNLLFLMKEYQKMGDLDALNMAEYTLVKMYSGGIFDHIGYGFCRYSTDQYFLVPHFEKMLYDNAWLMMAYCKAYEITKKDIYLEVAGKIASYISREMISEKGGFFSAQDADSEGEEGKYYLFEPEEIIKLLGEKDGKEFNDYFQISEKGNFEGKNIPNLLYTEDFTDAFNHLLPKLRAYRAARNHLSTDDKILTAWNSFMIVALCALYRNCREEKYLKLAKNAQSFIEQELCENDTLYVSYRAGKKGNQGFLDDYAGYVFALLSLYDATLDVDYLERAELFIKKAVTDFFDNEHGGFYLYGRQNEMLILRPKECYDGAVPSGNSLMTYNLMRISYLNSDQKIQEILNRQIKFMNGEAIKYPVGYSMYLAALSDYLSPPQMITVVLKNNDDRKEIPFKVKSDSIVRVLDKEINGYRLLNDKTTYYICQNNSCMPPVNELFTN